MFEKEAEEYVRKIRYDVKNWDGAEPEERFYNEIKLKQAYQQGAEFGYNKANKWHYVKDELPRKSDATLCELMPVFVAVKVGYNVSTYGTYWNLRLGKFECLDEVYAWCYAPEPPELPKEIKRKE